MNIAEVEVEHYNDGWSNNVTLPPGFAIQPMALTKQALRSDNNGFAYGILVDLK